MKKLDFNLLSENIEKAANYDLENNNVSSSSYYVYQKGNLTYKKHFGCDLKDSSPIGDKTIFRLASMTKPITAFAMMILIDRGLLSLDEPVSKIIPEFEEMYIGKAENGQIKCVSKAQTPITLRHVLTHTSGIGSGPVGDILMKELPSDKRKRRFACL